MYMHQLKDKTEFVQRVAHNFGYQISVGDVNDNIIYQLTELFTNL